MKKAHATQAATARLNGPAGALGMVTGNDADDRDLFGTRTTLAFNPTDTFHAYFLWDHFDEDDNRSRIGKQFCTKDVGPANVGGLGYSAAAGGLSPTPGTSMRGAGSFSSPATAAFNAGQLRAAAQLTTASAPSRVSTRRAMVWPQASSSIRARKSGRTNLRRPIEVRK